MIPVKDGQRFVDAHHGYRMIAYNCNTDGSRPWCLQVDSLEAATVYDFTLNRGDTNSPTSQDTGQPKVRTMVAPFGWGKPGAGLLPSKTPLRFTGRFTVAANYMKSDRWWELPLQIQRVRDTASDVPGSSPPFAINIERIGGAEYFKPVVWNMSHKMARSNDGLCPVSKRVMMPRAKPIDFALDYFDDLGGPNGYARFAVSIDGGPSQQVCNYVGETGFPSDLGNYVGFGWYAADGWDNRQLPFNIRFENLKWGIVA